MHPYFYHLNKTPCFNLLDLLTSDLRQITGDTYKVFFEKVLTFIYASELFRSESGQNQRKPGVLRLLNFCPIITQSSIRRTIPVAFIYQILLLHTFLPARLLSAEFAGLYNGVPLWFLGISGRGFILQITTYRSQYKRNLLSFLNPVVDFYGKLV